MRDYVAWLNGTSVARGTLKEVDAKARRIADSSLWKEFHVSTTLKVTRGTRQLFVSSVRLDRNISTGVL